MQMAATVTITRFLQPSDYGLAAVAMMCAGMAGYFTQLGVGRGIVQKPSLTKGNIRAAFTLGMTTGLAGFIIIAIFSPLLAIFFREPRLSPIIVAFGLSLVFQAMGMVAGGLLRRDLRIRDLAICDFLGYLLSTFGIGLPMAMHGFGVWALVGSNVSQPLIVAIAYFIARPHAIAPTFQREDYQHIAGFSAKSSAMTSIEALSGNLDTIIMGRIIGPLALGLYNRSYNLCFLPCYNLASGLNRVFYPTLARVAEHDRDECCSYLIRSERQMMSLALPFCAGGAVAAPTVIPLILGGQWGSAIPIFQVLCLVSVLDVSFHLPAIHLEVINRFRYKFILQMCFGFCLALGILLFAPVGGILAVGWTYAVLQALRTIGLHMLSARYMDVSVWRLFDSWIPGVVCAVVTASVLASVQHLLQHLISWVPPTAQLTILLVVAAGTVILTFRALFNRSVYEPWKLLFVR